MLASASEHAAWSWRNRPGTSFTWAGVRVCAVRSPKMVKDLLRAWLHGLTSALTCDITLESAEICPGREEC